MARRRWSLQELPSCSGRAFGVEQQLRLGSARRGGKPQLTTQCRIAVRQELAPPSRDDDGGRDQDSWQAVGTSRAADAAAAGGSKQTQAHTDARRQPRRVVRSRSPRGGQKRKGKRRDGDRGEQREEDPMEQVARDVVQVPADDLDAIHGVLDGEVRRVACVSACVV